MIHWATWTGRVAHATTASKSDITKNNWTAVCGAFPHHLNRGPSWFPKDFDKCPKCRKKVDGR